MTGKFARKSTAGRRARIVTNHRDAETAARIAAALTPDNTDEMVTRVTGDEIETRILRRSTGGLQATVDDYVVNLRLAAQLSTQDREPSTPDSADASALADDSTAGSTTDTDT